MTTLSSLDKLAVLMMTSCRAAIDNIYHYDDLSVSVGHITWQPLLELLPWYPLILNNSLQLIWRSGTHRFHLRVPDLQMSCSELTKWVGTSYIVPITITRVTDMPYLDISPSTCCKCDWESSYSVYMYASRCGTSIAKGDLAVWLTYKWLVLRPQE